jgi:hypothetical protein
MKITPAQKRMLLALLDAGMPLAGGELAFRSGYKGNGRSGAGRAPQWSGRVMLHMPEGLIRDGFFSFSRTIRLYELTERGRQVATDLKKTCSNP